MTNAADQASELYEGCLRVFPASPLRLSLFAASNLLARTRAHGYTYTRGSIVPGAISSPAIAVAYSPSCERRQPRRASPRRDVCRGMPRGVSQRRSIGLPIAFYEGNRALISYMPRGTLFLDAGDAR